PFDPMNDLEELAMSPNRRSFLQWAVGVPGVGALLGWLAPGTVRGAPAMRDVYKELGVRPLINAAGTYTALGGSLMAPEVVAAMQAAARQFVNLLELHQAVGKKIAGLIGCDAALVTSGAASALTMGTAA